MAVPLWIYAVFVLVTHARAAAEHRNVATTEIAQRIAARHGIGPPAST
jgi:hypothetical protein